MRTNDLLRHTAVLFVGMAGVHACNLVYQMTVSRALPSEEYALLMAFLGLLTILSYPLSALTSGLSHYSSLLCNAHRVGDIRRLLRKWLWTTGLPALLLGAAACAFSEPLSELFHLNRRAPVLIAGAVLPAMFWLPVLAGAAQGLQQFGWSAVSGLVGAILRLLLGAGLVWLWYPACGWAMLGHCAGIYLSAGVLAAGLYQGLRRTAPTVAPLPSLRFYLLQSVLVLVAFAVLMNADVVLAKHYLPGQTGFAYAATLGRIVAFLPMAAAMAMFPKVASAGAATVEHRRIFAHAFGFTALCTIAAAGGCWLLPRLLLQILFGLTEVAPETVLLTRWMAAAMAASALLNVVVQFLLAQRRFKALSPVVAAGALYLLCAHHFHDSALQLALACTVFNALALLALLPAAFRVRPAP